MNTEDSGEGHSAPRTLVYIKTLVAQMMLDGGSIINIMSWKLANKLGLKLLKSHCLYTMADRHNQYSDSIVKSLEVSIASTSLIINIEVYPHIKYPLLLECPALAVLCYKTY